MKPKLGDFGSPKILKILLEELSIIGSLFHMAPEIFDRNSLSYDPLAADVFRY